MIIVCSLNDLETVCNSLKPKNLISVIDPGYEPETPLGVKYHLKLGFDDILEVRKDNNIFRLNVDEIPQIPPNNDHVKSIVNFTDDLSTNDVTVIHCWCGVSRSMATATYLLCKEDLKNIDRNVQYIRSIAPHANPNKLLINLFEKYLNIKNEISKAYQKYPYTKVYDCSSNFAPITLFNIQEMKDFK